MLSDAESSIEAQSKNKGDYSKQVKEMVLNGKFSSVKFNLEAAALDEQESKFDEQNRLVPSHIC
jgi:hypothetical protein